MIMLVTSTKVTLKAFGHTGVGGGDGAAARSAGVPAAATTAVRAALQATKAAVRGVILLLHCHTGELHSREKKCVENGLVRSAGFQRARRDRNLQLGHAPRRVSPTIVEMPFVRRA